MALEQYEFIITNDINELVDEVLAEKARRSHYNFDEWIESFDAQGNNIIDIHIFNN